jgi:DNA-directed RNA polymerase subunit beta
LIEETLSITNLYDKERIFKKIKINFSKQKIKNEILNKRKVMKKKLKTQEFITYELTKYKKTNQNTFINNKSLVYLGEWVQKGEIIADTSATTKGELSLGKNILIAYMPWEGYNFEDAIIINNSLVEKNIYTSIHISKYEHKLQQTQNGMEIISKKFLNQKTTKNLDQNGLIKIDTWVKEGDILIGKVTPKKELNITAEGRLLRSIFGKESYNFKNSSFKVPPGINGRVINIQNFKKIIRIHIAKKRKLKTGDKLSGRHGNKGIVSKILPREDMPYLQNGTPIEIILNPLGVPSRMNIGQLFECLLGLAGKYLKENYRIVPFDESYKTGISKNIVYTKLYEAKKYTKEDWIFDSNNPGKSKIFDGRSGEVFEQPITIGYSYILKLFHLVDDKIQARSTGPYSQITQQPLKGKAKKGGQRLGEMEVWALQGFGAAYSTKLGL